MCINPYKCVSIFIYLHKINTYVHTIIHTYRHAFNNFQSITCNIYRREKIREKCMNEICFWGPESTGLALSGPQLHKCPAGPGVAAWVVVATPTRLAPLEPHQGAAATAGMDTRSWIERSNVQCLCTGPPSKLRCLHSCFPWGMHASNAGSEALHAAPHKCVKPD